MGSYYWYDITHTSYNEKKRDEYKKAASKLLSHKNTLYNQIVQCESFDGFSSVYRNSGELSGELIDLFYSKSSTLDNNVKSYIQRLWTVYNQISARLESAESLYNYYYNECIKEDEEGRRRWEEDN